MGEAGDKGKYSEWGRGLDVGLDSENVWYAFVFGWSAFEGGRPDAISLLTPCTPSLMPSNTPLFE